MLQRHLWMAPNSGQLQSDYYSQVVGWSLLLEKLDLWLCLQTVINVIPSTLNVQCLIVFARLYIYTIQDCLIYSSH